MSLCTVYMYCVTVYCTCSVSLCTVHVVCHCVQCICSVSLCTVHVVCHCVRVQCSIHKCVSCTRHAGTAQTCMLLRLGNARQDRLVWYSCVVFVLLILLVYFTHVLSNVFSIFLAPVDCVIGTDRSPDGGESKLRVGTLLFSHIDLQALIKTLPSLILCAGILDLT